GLPRSRHVLSQGGELIGRQPRLAVLFAQTVGIDGVDEDDRAALRGPRRSLRGAGVLPGGGPIGVLLVGGRRLGVLRVGGLLLGSLLRGGRISGPVARRILAGGAGGEAEQE